MIRHVVVFRFAESATEGQVEEIRTSLLALRDRVPEIRDLQAGRDLGLREGTADFAVVGLFDNEDGWRAYQHDEEHQRIIRELIEPVLAERLGAQFTV